MENGKENKNLQNENNVDVYENDEMYMLGDVKECYEEENESEKESNNSNGNNKKLINQEIHELDSNNNPNTYSNNINNNNNEITPNDNEYKTKFNFNKNPTKFSFNQSNNEEENEEDENSENLPLISLKYLSKCQCCQNVFNGNINIPYLFQCGHFFCKKCIEENFTDEEGIKCPNDGLIAYSLDELKILNNLINDNKYIESSNRKFDLFCQIHKGEKLTHFIENTKEMICVYCAFDKCKKNPNCEIKEIKDKVISINNNIDNIINDNQNLIEIIQQGLNNIKNNKESEERKIEFFFEKVFTILSNKKIEMINQIDTFYNENIRKLNQEINFFSNIIDECDNLKNEIENVQINFLEILDYYNKIKYELKDLKTIKIQLQETKFIYQQENKILNKINKICDIQILPRIFELNGINDINKYNAEDKINKTINEISQLDDFNNSFNTLNINYSLLNGKDKLFSSYSFNNTKYSFNKTKTNSKIAKKYEK